jgi:hypothetical protein
MRDERETQLRNRGGGVRRRFADELEYNEILSEDLKVFGVNEVD